VEETRGESDYGRRKRRRGAGGPRRDARVCTREGAGRLITHRAWMLSLSRNRTKTNRATKRDSSMRSDYRAILLRDRSRFLEASMLISVYAYERVICAREKLPSSLGDISLANAPPLYRAKPLYAMKACRQNVCATITAVELSLLKLPPLWALMRRLPPVPCISPSN